MDTLKAMALTRAAEKAGVPARTFDWDKAAQILRDRDTTEAEAGLAEDWHWTGGDILAGGKPDTESYTFLTSAWATPVMRIDGEEIPCWKEKASDDIAADAKWPPSALRIFLAGRPS